MVPGAGMIFIRGLWGAIQQELPAPLLPLCLPTLLLPTRVQIPQRARWSLQGEQEIDHRRSPSSRPQLEEEEERPLGTMFYGLGDFTDVDISVTELRPCWNQQGSQKSHGPGPKVHPWARKGCNCTEKT